MSPSDPATMTVRVGDRSSWSFGRTLPVLTVTIPAVCPRCGGPRGEPEELVFSEWMLHRGKVTYLTHRWFNPCGHVDLQQDVVAEARALCTVSAQNPDETKDLDDSTRPPQERFDVRTGARGRYRDEGCRPAKTR